MRCATRRRGIRGNTVERPARHREASSSGHLQNAERTQHLHEIVELFNLADDPYEKHNLARDNPARVEDLRGRYEAFARQALPPKSAPKASGFQSPRVWGEPE